MTGDTLPATAEAVVNARSGLASGTSLTAALAPLHSALLTAAERDVRRLRARSTAVAQQAVDDASAQAAEVRREARARGATDAAAALAAERARSGQQARGLVLHAQREEYEALHRAARAAVPALREEAGFPTLQRRMAEVVRRLLGADAVLRDRDGGIVGEADGRRIDCTLGSFLDRAVDEVLAERDVPSSGGALPMTSREAP